MLRQISIFAENKKGTMEHITRILKESEVNILGSVTNDSAEYGIVRMVVSDPDKAKDALEKAGYLCKTMDVMGVEIEDKPGALNSLLQALSSSNVSANYLYLSFDRERATPIMIIHTDEIMEVEECLKSKGFSLL